MKLLKTCLLFGLLVIVVHGCSPNLNVQNRLSLRHKQGRQLYIWQTGSEIHKTRYINLMATHKGRHTDGLGVGGSSS